MCGIVGVVGTGKAPVDTSKLKDMCDVIAHRGPDDAGYLLGQTGRHYPQRMSFFEAFTDQAFSHVTPMLPCIDSAHGKTAVSSHHWDVFLGHRRLSIIDLSSAGHQPMSDLSKTVWLAFNGEIYNFKEIRSELIALGYDFATQTDTEVIIYAYKAWGIQCVERFNGMFAFALWDRQKNAFYLARDRYGIKPLYYTRLQNGHVVFASEVKAILAYPGYKMGLDYEALLEYFTFQNLFTNKTLYEGVSILEAGHYLEIDLLAESPALVPHQYWDFDFVEPTIVEDERVYIEEFDRLFTQAVQRQLVSDVEVGSYLSGGIDSGSISAVAAQAIPYLKTFTIGFDLTNVSDMELNFDERKKSEQMSYLYKTEHYEMVLKSGDMERCLPKFAWHLEEPRVGQSYPNFYAAKLASKFVKVVLSGAGGDELFAGYPWRYYRTVGAKDFEDYIDCYYQFWQRLIDNKQLKQLFSPIWDRVSHVWTRDIFRDVFEKRHREAPVTPVDCINKSLYFEAKTFLHGLLVVEDKLSMAHSLETRVPYLDNDLVNFAMQVPAHVKLSSLSEVVKLNENEVGPKPEQYYKKTKDGKQILRKACERYMPKQTTEAIKQGFSSPDETWFKEQSNQFIMEKLLDQQTWEKIGLFSVETILALINAHLSGVINRRLFIWSMLNFVYWDSVYDVTKVSEHMFESV